MEFQKFVDDYYRQFIDVLRTFDKASLESVKDIFEAVTERGGTLWVAGNGGCASIRDHAVCDATKGALRKTRTNT